MEEDSYKQIIDKALSIGFVILYSKYTSGESAELYCYNELPTFPLCERHYLYNPALGNFRKTHYHNIHDPLAPREDLEYTFEQLKEKNLFSGSIFAPMIEAGCGFVSEEHKFVACNRLYIQSDFYDSQGVLIKQDKRFIKQYESLVRTIKKLAPLREIPCLPPYQDQFRKEYMTDYMFEFYKKGYEIRG